MNDDFDLGWNYYGFRNYDPSVGRWWNTDPFAEFSYDLSPYRFAYNNPILFSDYLGLWEKNSNGSYSTTDQKDIERFMNMTEFEGTSLTIQQSINFVEGEMSGMGKLSDGTTLLTGITETKSGNTWQPDNSTVRRTALEIWGSDKNNRGNFGNNLDMINKQYGLGDNLLSAASLGVSKLPNSSINKFSYEIGKSGNIINASGAVMKPGQIASAIKGFGKGNKTLKMIGKVGRALSLGKIAYDAVNDSWDASTGVDVILLVASFTPIGAGIAITYGTLDYFFNIGDKIDATIGRDSNFWRNE